MPTVTAILRTGATTPETFCEEVVTIRDGVDTPLPLYGLVNVHAELSDGTITALAHFYAHEHVLARDDLAPCLGLEIQHAREHVAELLREKSRSPVTSLLCWGISAMRGGRRSTWASLG